MNNLILFEIKQHKTSLFWWIITIIVLTALVVSIYPSIHQAQNQINNIMNKLPATLVNLKSGDSNLSVASPVGYLNSELYFITLPVVLVIMAISLGASLLTNEEEKHTIELLLSRPISRIKLLFSKFISGFILILIVNLIALLIVLVLNPIVKLKIDTFYLLLTNLYLFLFTVSFYSLAFGLSATGWFKKKTIISITATLVFIGYIFISLSSLNKTIASLSKIFPYYYYQPANLLSGHINYGLNIYIFYLIVLSLIFAVVRFRSRDIN